MVVGWVPPERQQQQQQQQKRQWQQQQHLLLRLEALALYVELADCRGPNPPCLGAFGRGRDGCYILPACLLACKRDLVVYKMVLCKCFSSLLQMV